MYLIYDFHLYFSYAGARADVRSLYITITTYSPDVSLAKWLIEKGESKYSTDSNELFVLTCFMFKCLPSSRGVCISVCVCVCVHCKISNSSFTFLGKGVYVGSTYVS